MQRIEENPSNTANGLNRELCLKNVSTSGLSSCDY
jgi:hypothetical protein